jgi:hypothetical protein
MNLAPSDSHHVAQSRRNVCLAISVVSPNRYGAITSECQTVTLAPSDGYHVAQSRRNIGLAVIVPPPSRYDAVTLKRETMICTTRNCYNVAQPGGCRTKTLPPLVYCALVLEYV